MRSSGCCQTATQLSVTWLNEQHQPGVHSQDVAGGDGLEKGFLPLFCLVQFVSSFSHIVKRLFGQAQELSGIGIEESWRSIS